MSESIGSRHSCGDDALPQPASRVVSDFEAAWRRGLRPRIEEHLRGVTEQELPSLLGQLVRLDAHYRFLSGETPKLEEYQTRFPGADPGVLAHSLEAANQSSRSARSPPKLQAASPDRETLVRHGSTPKFIGCPRCQNPVSLPAQPTKEIVCEACGNAFGLNEAYDGSTRPLETRTLGRFQLLEQLGVGSFGTVWRARDPQLDRTVAIKVLHAHLADSEPFRDRFLREARAAAQLDHPGIVRLYEVPVIEGVPVLVSDFIDGLSLQELLKGGNRSFREIAALVADVADALDYAHRRGLVHRDVKPANIMVAFPAPDEVGGTSPARADHAHLDHSVGKPVIVDFGLALRDTPETAMTMEGQMVGTPAYMSPEQIRHAHKAKGYSDVYSLGVVLYEMLCGELPFRGSKAMIIHQMLHEEPRNPRSLNDQIPRDLQTICLKAMAKLPAWRYQSAREMAVDLRLWLEDRPILSRPTGHFERGWRWCRRNPVVAGLILAVVVSVLGGTSAVSVFAFREQEKGRELAVRVEERDQAARAAIVSAKKASESEGKRWQQLYAAQIGRAESDYREGRVDWMLPRLDEVEPQNFGGRDLRGFEWPYLQRLARQDLQTLPCPAASLCAAIDGAGRLIAYGCADGSLHLRDLALARELWAVPAHHGAVTRVAFHPDGRRLFSGGADGKINTWYWKNGVKETELADQRAPISGLQISDGGARLVTSTARDDSGKTPVPARLHFLDAHTRRAFRPSLSVESINPRVALSPNGDCVAWVGGNGDLMQMLDCRSGRIEQPFSERFDGLADVAISPDGRFVAWGGDSHFIRVWDRVTKKRALTIGPNRLGFAIITLAFSGDGRIAAGTKDGPIEILEVQTGAELLRLLGHAGGAHSVAFSPDGRRLVSAGSDRTVKIWDAVSEVEPVTLQGHGPVLATAFDSHGRLACAVGREILIWDPQLRHCLVHISRPEMPSALALAFSPDERRLASGHADGHVRIWDTSTGQLLGDQAVHKGIVSSLFFIHGGRQIVSGGFDRTIKIWDADSKIWESPDQTVSFVAPSLRTGVRAMALSGDGKLLAIAGQDGTATIWSFADRRITQVFHRHHGGLLSVAFQPGTNVVASGGMDGVVWLWDATTGEVVQSLARETEPISVVCFSPDGRRLVVADRKRSVRLWDIATGRDLLRFGGHTSPVLSLAFHPDGYRFVTGCADHDVRLWDARPLTAEILDDREARSVVRFLADKGFTGSELTRRIEQDTTITDSVKRTALALAREAPYELVR